MILYPITDMIKDNLFHLNEEISSVCRKVGCKPGDIVLIGVTKYTDVASVKVALECGLTDIGENRVQDAQNKFESLGELNGIKKHLLGHLQTNKVKQAIELFDLIQSVDSIKLANEIEKQAERIGKKVEILIQINVAGEEQKSGVGLNDYQALFDHILELKNISVKGVMTIAPNTEDEGILRDCFSGLRHIFEDCKKQYSSEECMDLKYLSMGMSADFKIAIEEGANMVRIGSAIFKR